MTPEQQRDRIKHLEKCAKVAARNHKAEVQTLRHQVAYWKTEVKRLKRAGRRRCEMKTMINQETIGKEGAPVFRGAWHGFTNVVVVVVNRGRADLYLDGELCGNFGSFSEAWARGMEESACRNSGRVASFSWQE